MDSLAIERRLVCFYLACIATHAVPLPAGLELFSLYAMVNVLEHSPGLEPRQHGTLVAEF